MISTVSSAVVLNVHRTFEFDLDLSLARLIVVAVVGVVIQ